MDYQQTRFTSTIESIRKIDIDVYKSVTNNDLSVDNLADYEDILHVLNRPRTLDTPIKPLSSMPREKGRKVYKVDIAQLFADDYKTRLEKIEEGANFLDVNMQGNTVKVEADKEVVTLIRTVLTLANTKNLSIYEVMKAIFYGVVRMAYHTPDIKITKERVLTLLVVNEDNPYSEVIYDTIKELLEEQ